MNKTVSNLLLILYTLVFVIGLVFIYLAVTKPDGKRVEAFADVIKLDPLDVPRSPYTIDDKPASIYFTDEHDACDLYQLSGRQSLLYYKQKNKDMYDKLLQFTINNNCKYEIKDWNIAYRYMDSAPRVTPSSETERGNQKDWLRIAQPLTENDKGEAMPVKSVISPLFENVVQVKGDDTKDGKRYYVAQISTIKKNEIVSQVCDATLPFEPLLHGMYCIFHVVDVNATKPQRIELKKDGADVLDYRDWVRTADMTDAKTELVADGGIQKEVYKLVPKPYFCNVHVFMKSLCGDAQLYKKIPVTVSLKNEMILKQIPTSTAHLLGDLNTLQARADEYKAQLDALGIDPQQAIWNQQQSEAGTCKSSSELVKEFNLHDVRANLQDKYNAMIALIADITKQSTDFIIAEFKAGNIRIDQQEFGPNLVLKYASEMEVDANQVEKARIFVCLSDQSFTNRNMSVK